MLLRIGSRGSRLALTQAELAADRLRGEGVEIALVPITTSGDKDRTKPFGEIGSRGGFVQGDGGGVPGWRSRPTPTWCGRCSSPAAASATWRSTAPSTTSP